MAECDNCGAVVIEQYVRVFAPNGQRIEDYSDILVRAILNAFLGATTKPAMAWDFGRSVVPLVLIVAIASVALTTLMTPSTVFMMVLPSMVVFSIVAFYFGMKHGEFRTT